MTRNLVWTDHALLQLSDVVSVLNVINPKGHSMDHIRAHVQREFDKGLDTYIGTAGWYVTVYASPSNSDEWYALPTIMPYAVKHWLELHS